ncbi:MAG: molybdopterin-guanine dinucleotide biosynthesis protein MobB [Porticoccus sp.]
MDIVTLPTSQTTFKNITKLSGKRLAAAKRSFVTRNLPIEEFHFLVNDDIRPTAGDLILARVDKLGQHQRIELPSGRRAYLFTGDEVIVSYGNRYAPDQFLGHIPDTLAPCSLVAAGGIASEVVAKHSRMKNATKITPLGFLASHNKKIINLQGWQLPQTTSRSTTPMVLAVAGSSMNGGKTTTMAYLARGLVKAGLSVGAAKITGTGAGVDYWKMTDAGAYPVIDFTDMGLASTYKVDASQIESVMERQVNYLSHQGVDIILLEIADGLAQTETASLLQSKHFHSLVDGMFFASAEALSVQSAVHWIQSHDLPLIGISGALTASPMVLEETRQLCPVPVFTKEELGSAEFYQHLITLIHKQNLSISNSR